MLEYAALIMLGYLAWEDWKSGQVEERGLILFGVLSALSFLEWVFTGDFSAFGPMLSGYWFIGTLILTLLPAIIAYSAGIFGAADVLVIATMPFMLNWLAPVALFLAALLYSLDVLGRRLFGRFGGIVAFIPYLFFGVLFVLLARLHFIK